MNLSDYTFVALDLEATGLNTLTDKIIEVAAVRFQLEEKDGIYSPIHMEERTMLIDPEIELEENISMITGISDSMLKGKSKWHEVQDRVKNFIGESIIVGHNVLFDVNMLQSHGIDLKKHTILDTFELSEIFSQDAESLNLGFLGKKYKIPQESEHRALDDTKLSIGLFCVYLGDIKKLETEELQLWNGIKDKDTSHTLSTLLEITGKEADSEDYNFVINPYNTERGGNLKRRERKPEDPIHYEIRSMSGERQEELNLIKNHLTQSPSLLIITSSKKQSEYLESVLSTQGYSTSIYKDERCFCSEEMIAYWLTMNEWSRKEVIFLLKLITWVGKTKTGLLDELKYYGDERQLVELFRSSEGEKNRFFQEYKQITTQANIVFADVSLRAVSQYSLMKGSHTLIVKDIVLIEDGLRRTLSHHISFEEIFFLINALSHLGHSKIWEDLITGISFLGDIYRGTPTRPEGTEEFPPGNHGENYLITQKELWHNGNRWLILANKKIIDAYTTLKNISNTNPIEKEYLKKIEKNLEVLIKISSIRQENMSIILSIAPEDTRISLIPREIKKEMQNLILLQQDIHTSLIGYGIGNADTVGFLENECGITGKYSPDTYGKILSIRKNLTIEKNKTVLLTTSMKHIRSLVHELKGRNGITTILAQGLSGGKGKMITLFKNSREKSLLIGTIDNWIDESSLWEDVDEVIIAKVPFDPPTDPYFLARTSGMKNNFEMYSTPIAINTLNTLIGRIHFTHPKIAISCTDERLAGMNWGKKMSERLL